MMDRYDVMSILLRLKTTDSDPYAVSMLYSETLAEIAGRLSADEMRRLLMVGAYFCNGQNKFTIDHWGLDEAKDGNSSNRRLH